MEKIMGQLKNNHNYIVHDNSVLSGYLDHHIYMLCLFQNNSLGGLIQFSTNKDTHQDALKLLEQFIFKFKSNSHYDPDQPLHAKLAGGSFTQTETTNHYAKEILQFKSLLNLHKIDLVGESIGGNIKRKFICYPKIGRLQIAFDKHSPPADYNHHSQPSQTEMKDPRKRKVLIVDDSKTIRDLLFKVLQNDPQLEVIGQVSDPLQAEEFLKTSKPDVITLDIHMPVMTGVEWLKSMVPKHKIPVVMITSLELKDGNEVFEALELGAIDYIQKPTLQELHNIAPIIKSKIYEASYAKVRPKKIERIRTTTNLIEKHKSNIVVAIGSSTGGTEALRTVLCGLPENIPPIIIVQHIPAVFSKAFADRMNKLCPFEVKEAEQGDIIQNNRVLIAPGGTQMKLAKRGSNYCIQITDDEPVNRHKPSVDYLFYSVAEQIGSNAIGAILTGMGADGAKGLLAMKEKGAITLSQNEESCVVYGMPKAAWEAGASQAQVDLDHFAETLVKKWTKTKMAA